MGNLFYFILIVLLSSFIAGVVLVLMVKKYYWGPTGLPPKQRYQPEKSKDISKNGSQSAENKNK